MTVDQKLELAADDLRVLVTDLDIPRLNPDRPLRYRLVQVAAILALVVGGLVLFELVSGQSPPVVTQVPTTAESVTTTSLTPAISGDEARFETSHGILIWHEVVGDATSLPQSILALPSAAASLAGAYMSPDGTLTMGPGFTWRSTPSTGAVNSYVQWGHMIGADYWGDYGSFDGQVAHNGGPGGGGLVPLMLPAGFPSNADVLAMDGAMSTNGSSLLVMGAVQAPSDGRWTPYLWWGPHSSMPERFSEGHVMTPPWGDVWSPGNDVVALGDGRFGNIQGGSEQGNYLFGFGTGFGAKIQNGPAISDGEVWTTRDGTTWTNQGTPAFVADANDRFRSWSIQERKGMLVAVLGGSVDGDGSFEEWESTDGITWTRYESPFPAEPVITETSLGLVAVVHAPAPKADPHPDSLWMTADGHNWSQLPDPPPDEPGQPATSPTYSSLGATGRILYRVYDTEGPAPGTSERHLWFGQLN